jgi:hypothetical protein
MSSRQAGGPPRRARREQRRPELLVFVEGTKTEDGYLLPLRRELRAEALITVDNRGGAPLTLVERARSAKQDAQHDAARGRGRAYDEVWCMFDHDEHPNVPQALTLAANSGINVVMSNPCLELWFILHLEDQTAAIDRHTAQHRSSELLGCKKNLTPAALERLYTHHGDARRRAQQLDAKHLDDGSPPRSNPSSDVWRLVDQIRALHQ